MSGVWGYQDLSPKGDILGNLGRLELKNADKKSTGPLFWAETPSFFSALSTNRNPVVFSRPSRPFSKI